MKSAKTVENGLFISFEGPEGAGKTTQAKLVADTLRGRGYDVCEAREPGGTRLGEQLRQLLTHSDPAEAVSPEAELLMFGASRAQLMQRLVLPHLQRGGVVVCDRFADSTTVYQGVARGLDRAFIDRMHALTMAGRWPDLTLLLDLPAQAGLERTRQRKCSSVPCDRFEAEPGAFHEAVRAGFLQLAAAFPDRVTIIDASDPADTVRRRVMEIVDRALGAIS